MAIPPEIKSDKDRDLETQGSGIFLRNQEGSYERVDGDPESFRNRFETLIGEVNHPLSQGPHLTGQLSKHLQGVKLDQGVKSLDELRAVAGRFIETHNKLTEEVAQASGGRAKLAQGLKAEARMWDKAAEYGDPNQIGDVVRTVINFDDLNSLYKAFMEIYRRAEVVRIKDRFVNPKSNGYRDMLFNIRLQDVDTGETHVTEVQLHLQAMYDAKKQEYPNYIKARDLRREMKDLEHEQSKTPDLTRYEEIKDRIVAIEKEISWLDVESRDIYDAAWEPFDGQIKLDAA